MMNAPDKYVHTWLPIVLLMTAVIRIALAFRNEFLLYGLYYQEDAFYLLNCAEHVARGQGFTVDGVNPTNGVQPLLVLLYVPLFLLSEFDKTLVLRISYIYPAIFDCVSAYLIYRILLLIRRKKYDAEEMPWSPLIGALAYGLAFPVFVHTVSGLETGLVSMLLLLSLFQYARISISRREGNMPGVGQYLLLALTLGFTILARIDSAIYVAALCMWEFSRAYPKRLLRSLMIGSVSLALSLPWWIYNVHTFGSLLPQSGISESIGSVTTWNTFQMLGTMADCMTVFFSATKMNQIPTFAYIGWCVLVFSGVVVCLKLFPLQRFLGMYYHLIFLVPAVITCVCYAIYYVGFFSAPYFIPRYMQPFRIVMIIIASICIPVIVSRWKKQRITRAALWLALIAALLNTSLRYPRNFYSTANASLYHMGLWAREHPGDKVGMHQSGISGFVAANVVNLDGKVNFNALKARLENSLGQYIIDEGITYLADWDTIVKPLVQEVHKYGVNFKSVDTVDDVRIYKRVY